MSRWRFFFLFLALGCAFVVGLFAASTSSRVEMAAAKTDGLADLFLPVVSNPLRTTTRRISVTSSGNQVNGFSYFPSISADGRFIAYASDAPNLVPNDTNDATDIFLYSLETSGVTLISTTSSGDQANGPSYYPAISPDGRYIAFESDATNLVADDSNGFTDIFVHDRETGDTTRVSVASDGTQGNEISRYAAISVDGRYVVFESLASNLVPNDTNDRWDVFAHDRQTGNTTRLSVSSHGAQGDNNSNGASISADGRFVSFLSSMLVSGDTNNATDAFVHDMQSGETSRVSVASDGTQANGGTYCATISGDGRFVVFGSLATNLVGNDTNGFGDIFVHDQESGETTLVSAASDGTQGNWDAFNCAISANGRFVAFNSFATNLVPGDTNDFLDIFFHDRQLGSTIRVSVTNEGGQASKHSYVPRLSADGTIIAFHSIAWNLVNNDTNGAEDVFIRILGLE